MCFHRCRGNTGSAVPSDTSVCSDRIRSIRFCRAESSEESDSIADGIQRTLPVFLIPSFDCFNTFVGLSVALDWIDLISSSFGHSNFESFDGLIGATMIYLAFAIRFCPSH